MKTLRLKATLAAWVATMVAVVVLSGSVYAQSNGKYSLNLKTEKTAINKDLGKIDQQQDKVKALKQQCHDERMAGVKASGTHSELMKARADLTREKAYLKADKTALFDKHQAHINEHRDKVREDRAELMRERRQLNADLNKGNSSAVARAEAIVNKKHEIAEAEDKLRQAKLDRNADVLAINKEIKDVNGAPAIELAAENTSAKAQNLALK
jgi:chromosome segregation ATPase